MGIGLFLSTKQFTSSALLAARPLVDRRPSVACAHLGHVDVSWPSRAANRSESGVEGLRISTFMSIFY